MHHFVKLRRNVKGPSTLHHKIAKMNLNSTWRTYLRGSNIWPCSVHSLGLDDGRFHVRRVQHVRIYKTAKFHWIWNCRTQNIANFDPQYLVFQGLPSLAFAIFVISSMRWIISERFSQIIGVRFPVDISKMKLRSPWRTFLPGSDFLPVFSSLLRTWREKILCFPC